jgi:tRNA (guanine37-N1)-methyltransferase
MVMKIEPVWKALRDIVKEPSGKGQGARKKKQKIILLTPQGKRLDQSIVKRLAKEKQLVLVCGHYEGVDERIRRLVDEEISIGDYILTCGELPAMVLVDAVARLKPGVLGNSESAGSESFEGGLLEYPQYTRPAEFAGMRVPEVLISGDHRKIDAWRKAESVKRTIERRPDLVGSRVRGKGLYKKEMRNE